MSRAKTYFLDYDPKIIDLNIIHKEGCLFLPANTNFIGFFENEESALDEVKDKYQGVFLCPLCCSKVLNEV